MVHCQQEDDHVLMPMDQLDESIIISMIMRNEVLPVPNGSVSCEIEIRIFNRFASTSISR